MIKRSEKQQDQKVQKQKDTLKQVDTKTDIQMMQIPAILAIHIVNLSPRLVYFLHR